ncbi:MULTISPECIES: DUF1573 domain-containing protein [unclassified Pedobacter]|uniref:DUF1573 domain-containing protein n=1 Tax=Pedobacter TaxID=84567 RepID=UPI00224590C6|nr:MULTISPECIES: DUF1573 domain-containing protein [unclassified Pedobacter]MCX2429466.1 DUF1573 domain-containing protein [Pedobacter sp. GR22-10]MCX2586353.1 DUF1573 domain-containing protein [Pedobacter sp. MR22-3]
MKKILVLFAFVLGFGVVANAQSKPADFKFESETHDFGKIPMGKPVTFDFKYTNVGEEPLIISKAEASCGCTVPKYTSTPIKKGETGVISVTFNAAAGPSAFSKAVTLTSNAKTPIKVLYIKGETVAASSK